MKKKLSIVLIMVSLAALFFIGCNNKLTDKKDKQNETMENAQEIVAEASDLTDQVVTTNIVENAEGNYTIPIPDEWIGKYPTY